MNNLAVLSLILFSVSCASSNNESANTVSIDIRDSIDPATHNYTVQNYSVIPLETTTESLFGIIERIEYFDDKFFMLDVRQAKGLFVFSKNGKFLGRTKLGKGPDEMVSPRAFYIDKRLKNLVIWDRGLEMLCTYDFDLNLQSKKKLDNIIYDLNKVDDKIILYGDSPELNAYRYAFYTEDFDESLFFRDFLYETDGGQVLSRPISIADKTLLITPNNYNIYQLNDESISSEYYLDFGSDSFNQDDFKTTSETVWEQIVNKRYVSPPLSVFESKSFVGFDVMYGWEHYTYLISKVDEELISVNDLRLFNNLPKFVIMGVTDPYNSNIYYGMIDPMDLDEHIKNDTSRNKIVKVAPSAGDNPYMIFLEIEK